MCGIYATNRNVSSEHVLSNINKIKFRGPDNQSAIKVNNVFLGHVRLSIIDTNERSDQPLIRGVNSIVYNGEIYNYLDIKNELIIKGYEFYTNSDTEVLLASYEEWGEECVKKINGMFSFAIYNSTKNTFFCARDRLGVKPFYYYFDGEFLELSSQLSPIELKDKIDSVALSYYLDLGYIPSPYSIYQNVKKLEPGFSILFDLETGFFVKKQYWELKDVIESNITFDEAKEHLHDLLKDAIRIRLNSDVKLGTLLSGGIDSALVTSIASKISPQTISTFSVGFDEIKFDESKIAAKFSKILGTSHNSVQCSSSEMLDFLNSYCVYFDEPFADSSALPTMLISKFSSKIVKVVLTGDGGDESFIGYNHFSWINHFQKLTKIPLVIRIFFSYFILDIMFKQRAKGYRRILNTTSIDKFILDVFYGFSSILKIKQKFFFRNHFAHLSNNLFQNAADYNIKFWLEGDSNVKVDRATMAYSIEARSPFLDYRIVEFARNLPMKYKFYKDNRKIILREILKEYIPENEFNVPKKGFSIPLEKWIRTDLKKAINEILIDDFLYSVPNLDVKLFKKILFLHQEKEYNYSFYIWNVFVLGLWCKENKMLYYSQIK